MAHTGDHYYVPHGSHWPIVASIGLATGVVGAAIAFNGGTFAVLLAGLAIIAFMMFGWFSTVVGESEAGRYRHKEDLSFRWGMGWFIFSEVMFFASFFGALFYARVITMPSLGDFDHKLLWPDFTAAWPHAGPGGVVESFTKIHAWPLPTINTILLVTSGIWLTIAHHALRANHRGKAAFWLFMTLAFGFAFVGIQAYEYAHAYKDLNLRLDSGIFGSTFFMLTGFHGFHVLVGAIMLTVVLLRVLKGHFKPEHHFAFEAAAWYWHFVDVVWIGLYIVVYWL